MYDFGRALRSLVRAGFIVKNTGAYPVRLTRVDLSCPCLTTDLVPQMLAAGTSRPFSVTLDASEFTPAFHGPIVRTIYLTTNDPARPEVTLTLRAALAAA